MESGGYGDGGAGSEFNPLLIHLAFICTVVGSCISFFSVWLHWKNYRKPNQQRQVIRILWMVPIYGISTYISLISLNTAFYVDTFRDIYEAFVIYAFFNLLLNKLGGERSLIIMLHSRPPTENFFPGTIYSREIFVGDPYTFLFVKRGILQFVYVKPVLAVITMALKATGNYHEGQFTWTSSYLYLTFFYNLSVCLSLWCLMVFFYATKKDLTKFRPLPKFLCVKAIIFFSFWQGVVIALLVFAQLIPETEHISVAIQDFLVCIEMVPFAIAHSFSFSYEDYFDQDVHSARMPVRMAIKDSLGLKDVLMDSLETLRGSGFSYRSFEPSEGVPHMGSSRTSRIMAGLRYSNITTKKHWLEPAPTSRFLNNSGRGMNDEEVVDEDSEPLEFEDPQSTDEMEILYKASKRMEFGDYNYPVIDFRAPLWRQVRRDIRRRAGYGGTSAATTNMDHHSIVYGNGDSKGRKKKQDEERLLGPREGCIDVIIEQGKGHYVLVEDLMSSSSFSSNSSTYSDDDNLQRRSLSPVPPPSTLVIPNDRGSSSPTIGRSPKSAKKPSPPVRNPTLSVKREDRPTSPTLTQSNKKQQQPSPLSKKKQPQEQYKSIPSQQQQQQKAPLSRPVQQLRYSSSNNAVVQQSFSTPSPSVQQPQPQPQPQQQQQQQQTQQQTQIQHQKTQQNDAFFRYPEPQVSMSSPHYQHNNQQNQEDDVWKWPDDINTTSRNVNQISEEDLLSGDVWK